ncbi:MAG: putative tricarboxylic transport rane protein [Thermoanaerobacter sp.]|nr:putative tricarboxylic transport rane protein [Thermoanaerobacter sp.]
MKVERKIKIFLVSMLVLVLALVAGCGQKTSSEGKSQGAASDKFPNKPITLICPYDAGGGSDQVTRFLASIAEKELGVPINVVNMPGGSGATGYAELTKREPDGYTLCTTTSTIVTHKLLGNLDVNHRDYELVFGYNYEPAAIGVNASRGWNTLEDFIKYCKKNPGKVSMGTSAFGGIWNIATHAAMPVLGVQWNVVPAGGGGAQPVVQAAGGKIDAVTASPLEMNAQVQAGKLKILAVMSDERLESFPDIPTFKELGYDLSVTTTRAIIAPKGTPQDRIKVLYEAFAKAAESQKYKDFLKTQGSGWMSEDGEAMLKYYDEQEKEFEKILKQK